MTIAFFIGFFAGLAIGAAAMSMVWEGVIADESRTHRDAHWLTPEERLSVQTPEDAQIALKIIAARKAAAQEN